MTKPECDCRAKENHPLYVIAKMPDGEWHEPVCAVADSPEEWKELAIVVGTTLKEIGYELPK